MNTLTTKLDDIDAGKLKTVPVDLKTLSDVVGIEVFKNTKFNTLKTKVNNLDKKILDETTLIQINQYNTDEQNLEKKIGDTRYQVPEKIPDASGLVTTTVLNTKLSEVENKTPNSRSLVTTTILNARNSEVENKIPYNS